MNKRIIFFTIYMVLQVTSYAQEAHVTCDSCAEITKGKELPRLEFTLPVIEEAIKTVVLHDLKYHSVNPDSVIVEVVINKVENTFFLEVSAPNNRKWEAPDSSRIDLFVGYVSMPHCLVFILDIDPEFSPIPDFVKISINKEFLYLKTGSPIMLPDGSIEWGFRFTDDEQLILYRRDFFGSPKRKAFYSKSHSTACLTHTNGNIA